MKNTSSTINKIATIVGLSLGAFAISVFAQTGTGTGTGTWTAPLAGPPDCISGNPGCDAPLNVSSTLQKKLGSLKVGLSETNAVIGGLSVGNFAAFGNFIYKPSAAAVTPGSVLAAVDTAGTVAWQPSAASINQAMQVFATSGTWTAPAGVTKVNIEMWGAGGAKRSGSYAYTHQNTVIPGSSYAVGVGTAATGGRSSFNVAFSGVTTIAAGGNQDNVGSSGTFVINRSYAPPNEGATAPRGGAGAVYDYTIRGGSAPGGWKYCYPAVVPGGSGNDLCNELVTGEKGPEAKQGAAGRVILTW